MRWRRIRRTDVGTLAGPWYWTAYWVPCLVSGLVARGFVRPCGRELRAIAVLAPEHIGDLVVTVPLLRALRQGFPGVRLVVAAAAPAAELVEACPHVDEVIPWGRPAGVIAAVRVGLRLRARRMDVTIVPRADPSGAAAALAALISGAPRRIALADCVRVAHRLARLQAAPFASEIVLPPANARHETQRRLAVARYLGTGAVSARPEVWTLRADDRAAAGFLRQVPRRAIRVALGIGASSPNRHWPVERFAELINRLPAWRAIAPIIIGGPEDVAAVRRLRELARVPVYALAGATVRESIAVLRACDLFVGNDSGPAHLASASGLPTIVISAHPTGAEDPHHPSHPAKCGPACAVSRVLRPPAPATAACRGGCVARLPHCILAVSVDAVLQAVVDLAQSAGIGPGWTTAAEPAPVVDRGYNKPPARSAAANTAM